MIYRPKTIQQSPSGEANDPWLFQKFTAFMESPGSLPHSPEPPPPPVVILNQMSAVHVSPPHQKTLIKYSSA
jgi:hypothetical protein